MFLLRIVLFPFALLYDLVTSIRNYLYDRGFKPSATFEVPVVSVGNLTAGGTGKTPMVEYLIRTLSSNIKMATVSRGYGRKTRGYRVVNETDNATLVGDEPFQIFRKFKDQVKVIVAEDRALAIPTLLHEFEDTQAILLDDAYQHRRVHPALTVLLCDFNRPFYKDFIIPTGYLRESRKGAARADVVVVTKCPADISNEAMLDISRRVGKYTNKPVFFSSVRYGTPKAFGHANVMPSRRVVLVTGIANAGPLKKYVEKNFDLVLHVERRDHHHYTKGDIRKIKARLPEGVCLLTTEKDMVKIADFQLQDETSSMPLFYIPIEMFFIKNGQEFDALVKKKLNRAI